jgi:RNA polymerase sigma-32 factor
MKKILDQVNTNDKEYQIISKWKETQDGNLFNQIIKDHYWLIHQIAKNYRNSGLQYKDLVAEGVIGLAIALEKFDVEKSVKFSTYAGYWIKAKMNEFVWKFKNTVYISSNKLAKFIGEMMTNKPDLKSNTDKIAYEVFRKPIYHMDDKISDDLQWKDVIQDKSNFSEDHEEYEDLNLAQELLKKSIILLDKRSREIIEDRWFVTKPKSYREIAERYNLSVERIRQIEISALETLKKNVKQQLDNMEGSIMGQLTIIKLIFYIATKVFTTIN